MKQEKLFENNLPVRPKRIWDTIEEYVLYLKQLAAYVYTKERVDKKSVLEVGCGAGYGASYLSKYSSNIVAVDISKKFIGFCHARYKKKGLNFVQASGLNLPIKDNLIDVVVSFQVIEHIEPKKVRDYLSEVERVLRDGGVFVASTPNKKLRLLPFQKPCNPEHEKEYDYKEFKKVLSDVFEEVKVYGLKGSEEIQSIERNRVKQNPLKVYIIKPFIPLMKKMLPRIILFQLKGMKNSIVRYEKKRSLIAKETFKKIRISDFKVMLPCPKDCLDFYGACKKTEKGKIRFKSK